MFGPVGGVQELVLSTNRQAVEGTGVIVTDSAAQSRPVVWRLRVEEAAGVQVKSEWIQVFHRRDHERKGFIPASDLFQHEHKMSLSACEGDSDKLDELCDALAGATGPLATATVLPFTLDEGLCRPMWQSNWQGSARHIENWIEHDNQRKVSSARAISQCSTRASTPAKVSRFDYPMSALHPQRSISACPSAIHCSTHHFSGASISIGLVSADQAGFRGEILVRRCYNNPAKVRGLGCAWRSDGLLLSQYLSTDGTPITWSGRTASFAVNDEPEIRFKPSPSGASASLVLNGKIVAGFPDEVLHWTPAWKLAVRVHRSRVRLLSEVEEPVATRLCISRPSTARPRSVRRANHAVRNQNSTGYRVEALDKRETMAKQEFAASERLRTQLEIYYQSKALERSQPNEGHRFESQAHFPPTCIPGVGIKLAVDLPAKTAKLEKSLEARVAANRARRLASRAMSTC